MRRAALAASAVAFAVELGFQGDWAFSSKGGNHTLERVREKIEGSKGLVPCRKEQVASLSDGVVFDVLVVGGGATGSGVALDAATRGLRVGLVEREDFSSGTSSRSTKLLHGGVRYLEKAVFNLDYGQLKLVFHALEERKRVIQNAPHICHPLPTMTPCFSWFEVAYYWLGLKMYDLVAGPRILHLSRYYSVKAAVAVFPMLSRESHGRNLRGAVVYYDGQMDDSRLNIGVACTAALAGAAVLNHAEVISLHKDEQGCVIGACVRDNLTGKEFDVHTKVRHSDVLSAWSGIRPLATDPSAKDTASIRRDHIICVDCPGLITITGGKWTTYRSMAEDAVDAAIKHGNLSPLGGCVTANLPIIGAYGWEASSFIAIAQNFLRMKVTRDGKTVPGTMDTPIAKHLSRAYGSMAMHVAAIAQNESLGKRLAHGHPYMEAEVAYCARNEYCESAIDFIARRTRLAFLDRNAAIRALPRVVELLTNERGWGPERQEKEMEDALFFLATFKSGTGL
ncbi:hypothetical protein AMTR_s00009p00266730 [Amborella trichopoda]|uniref:Glycerol-3-phosphate dehydrogenase n=1 Tax=Amborella trichopoda TaxID=13333 RepID=W1NIE1_AMBTC|nr:hypothetical protein AMTR_s00009p00266730 [Amborella trichopoda]